MYLIFGFDVDIIFLMDVFSLLLDFVLIKVEEVNLEVIFVVKCDDIIDNLLSFIFFNFWVRM